jgi:hypothetical protein
VCQFSEVIKKSTKGNLSDPEYQDLSFKVPNQKRNLEDKVLKIPSIPYINSQVHDHPNGFMGHSFVVRALAPLYNMRGILW